LHILHKSLGVSDRLHTPFQRLVAGDAQLEADVNVRDSLARVRPQMVQLRISREMRCTALKSPGEEMGKPASITSTPISSSTWAISTFSLTLRAAPGDCSPSRRVVSRMITRSVAGGGIAFSLVYHARG
jgi:hypothetical protein